MQGNRSFLGEGIYTAADAARILDIPYPKAKYWFKYYAKTKFPKSSNHIYHFEIKDIVAVNFLTLIEMFVFYTLKENKVSSRKIIEAHSAISSYLNTPYPFAKVEMYVNKDRSLLFSDNIQLISADRSLQIVIEQVLRPFIKKIQFSDDGFARKFYPLGKKKSIVVNPENQFGQPVIEGTNILTQTIFTLSKGGDSPAFIAKLYDLPIKKVREAIEFSAKAA